MSYSGVMDFLILLGKFKAGSTCPTKEPVFGIGILIDAEMIGSLASGTVDAHFS
jgi:hypothetical protein